MKPLTPDQRAAAASTLRELADELVRPKSGDVQRLLGDMLDTGYPTTSSATPSARANKTDDDGRPIQPDTKPEQLAVTPDREAASAAQLLADLNGTARAAGRLVDRLRALRPDRPVRVCPRCQHPLQPDSSRCQQVDDEGRRCSTSETEARSCMICEKAMKPGEPLRGGRCNACRLYLRRHGRDRTTIDDYQLQDNIVVQDNTITGAAP